MKNQNWDKALAKFKFGARKDICKDGVPHGDDDMKNRKYSASSMKNFRYGLNRVLKKMGHLYGITDKNTTSFSRSPKRLTLMLLNS